MHRTIPKGTGPAEARFNQLAIERFSTDVVKAINHSSSRNERVAQAACFFSLIRSTAPNLASARVLIEAAQRRMFSSPAGFEAAHYLPCQLTIHAASAKNPEFPWSFVRSPAARERLEYLFADVEHLPPAFNKADSVAELKGLRETFRSVAEQLFRNGTTQSKTVADKSLINKLYDEIWIPGASKSYNAAISQKLLVSEVPPIEFDEAGNITNLGERSTADWSRDDEIDILRRYDEALRKRPSALSDENIGQVEALFAR